MFVVNFPFEKGCKTIQIILISKGYNFFENYLDFFLHKSTSYNFRHFSFLSLIKLLRDYVVKKNQKRHFATKSCREASFSEKEGKDLEKEGSFSEKERKDLEKEGSFCEKEGSFSRKEGSFSENEGKDLEKEGSFCKKEGSFCKKEGSFCKKEASFLEKEASLQKHVIWKRHFFLNQYKSIN